MIIRQCKGKLMLIGILIIIITLLSACTNESDKSKPLDGEEDTEVSKSNNNNEETTDKVKEAEAMEEEPINRLTDIITDAPEEPTTLDEILLYPTGPLAGNGRIIGEEPVMSTDELAEYVMNVLPPIEEDADEAYLEEWWKAYRYLFAEAYPDPRNIITEMKWDNFGNEGIEDERFHMKDQINVLIILDVSGSMANEIDGKSMMEIAKDSIIDFTTELPEEANIGLRVYGHEGKSTGKTREQSCQATDLIYDFQSSDGNSIENVIDPFEPTGWTPIALSLEKVKEDFSKFPGEQNNNLVYIVSDGAETCDGDPASVAKELAESEIQTIINVIGFNVDIEGQNHLREIADAGGGIYTNAGNEKKLNEAFDQAEQLIERWKKWKNGMSMDAHDETLSQKTEVREFLLAFRPPAMDELTVRTNVIRTLRKEKGYITREASDFLLAKNKENYDLYIEEMYSTYETMIEEIEMNYEQQMKKIEEAYDENVEE
ncbi:Ca-activated chloride channel family protein [Gracilibacillus ureilyticus]|uniref:Ca-activated chloride channel family protein n=1 Tax=Gracilibacillus ureilyticus TaxID=531814 RepID=A0A1H9VJ85_9BACI|nr:VWA domain-containing protein [Gracilibacillus ureilyticus]SES21387.1 Ca-activated chloride channel family protein [Gracilibacillus ureilyticus]